MWWPPRPAPFFSNSIGRDMGPVERFETILSSLSIFESLRKDEIGRVALLFQRKTLEPAETFHCGSAPEDARMVVVVHGQARLDVSWSAGALTSTLEAGDRYGDIPLLTGTTRETTVTAAVPTELATLDRAGMDAILAAFPAVALPIASELATDLRAKNDVLRELLEVHAEGLEKAQLEAAVDARRRALAHRGARVARLSPRALFRSLVSARGAEPPFWMLTGFIVSMSIARLIVALILKYKLEKQLFALVPGHDPNPMHVHHFNYGLILIGTSGLAALFPFGRRALRVLACAFGVGCGLVFDEFALFWNLNPEYAQSLSLIAAAIMVSVLVQLTYFRRYWAALGRRAFHSLGGRR
jgi:CRP-like cAMP-binding protein